MSVSTIAAINQAALLSSDPAFQSVSQDQWLALLNQVCREMAQKLRLVKWTATGTLAAGVELYTIPDDCVTLTRVQFSPTPGVIGSWRDVNEMFEDEYRNHTSWQYPVGEPRRYFLDANYLYLDQIPALTVEGGLRTTYWGLPNDVPSWSSTSINVPDTLRDFMVRGMVTEGLAASNRWDEYKIAKSEWVEELVSKRDRMEDRGGDRRSRLRPASSQRRWPGTT